MLVRPEIPAPITATFWTMLDTTDRGDGIPSWFCNCKKRQKNAKKETEFFFHVQQKQKLLIKNNIKKLLKNNHVQNKLKSFID